MSKTKHVKYPRTPHLPWSPGRNDDDVHLNSIQHLEQLEDLVVTEKLDGENTTIYHDYLHARSVDSSSHASRNWIKRFSAEWRHRIPEDFRVCGENVFARHSIFYRSLTSYFYVFAIFQNDICLSWDETVICCESLGVEIVPVLYRGKWEEPKIKACWRGASVFGEEQEGYVVRNAASFGFKAFTSNVAKHVRAAHVKTDSHWMSKAVVPNQLTEHF